MDLARRLVKAAIAVTVPHPSETRFIAGMPESPKASLARQTLLERRPRLLGSHVPVARTGQSAPTGLTEHFSALAWTIGRGGGKFSSDGFLSGFESEVLDGLTKEALFKELFQTITRRGRWAKDPATSKPIPKLQKIVKGLHEKKRKTQTPRQAASTRTRESGAAYVKGPGGPETAKVLARRAKKTTPLRGR